MARPRTVVPSDVGDHYPSELRVPDLPRDQLTEILSRNGSSILSDENWAKLILAIANFIGNSHSEKSQVAWHGVLRQLSRLGSAAAYFREVACPPQDRQWTKEEIHANALVERQIASNDLGRWLGIPHLDLEVERLGQLLGSVAGAISQIEQAAHSEFESNGLRAEAFFVQELKSWFEETVGSPATLNNGQISKVSPFVEFAYVIFSALPPHLAKHPHSLVAMEKRLRDRLDAFANDTD
jgi:hypothetical protein